MTRRFRVVTAMVLGALLTVAALMGGGRLLAEALASDSVPESVNYQGFLTDSGGNPISSTVTLQFSIWDASSGGNQVWSETHNNVSVSGGYFSVFLGSQGTPLTPSVFSSTSRYLEVTFGATTFSRQRFASVPYALVAHKASTAITSTYATTATYASNAGSASNASNATNATNATNAVTATYASNADNATNATNATTASQATTAISATYATTATYALNAPGGGSVEWENVVVVAKSGGDYTSITDAMNAISPSSSERYLVLVMPGVYEEQVTVKQYVHLKGAGEGVTFVSSQANNANFNDNSAVTLIAPADSQISDLTVRNDSTTNDGVALKVTTGNSQTVLRNVRIETNGVGGDQHVGLYLNSGSAHLVHVSIVVSGGASNNWGIFNSASSPTIQDTTIAATGNGTAGLRMNGGNPVITQSTISGTNGTNGQGINTSGAGTHTVKIDHSIIVGDSGTGSSIASTDSYEFYVGASLVQGDVDVFVPADITCAQSYDGNYADVDANCQ